MKVIIIASSIIMCIALPYPGLQIGDQTPFLLEILDYAVPSFGFLGETGGDR